METLQRIRRREIGVRVPVGISARVTKRGPDSTIKEVTRGVGRTGGADHRGFTLTENAGNKSLVIKVLCIKTSVRKDEF